MKKIAVVYWSGTGNTEAMARFVSDGIQENNNQPVVFSASDFDFSKISEFDSIAFGCPASGNNELEESEFEPMFSEIETSLNGKKVALFGSYSWGNGEWMEDWKERTEKSGASIVGTVTAVETPSKDDEEKCKNLGKNL